LIVRAAPKFQILNRRRAAERKRVDVMKLKVPSFAASALSADECASPRITSPNRTTDGSRNVP
jgi:hypothetical protein